MTAFQSTDFRNQITRLVSVIQAEYINHYRDDEDIDYLQLTVGSHDETTHPQYRDVDTEIDWGFQTGDNSYTGGAYGFPNWAVAYIDDEVEISSVVDDIIDELEEQFIGW